MTVQYAKDSEDTRLATALQFSYVVAMKIFKIMISMMLCCVLAMPSAQARSTSNAIAAVVNDDIITVSELADRIQMIMASAKLPKTREFRQRIMPQVLEGLVAEKIQMQEAKRLDIAVTDQEVDNAFEGLAKQNNVSADKFQKALRHKGIPVESLKRQLRAQIAWSRVVQSQIAPRVVITDTDIDATLQRRDGMVGKDEYLVAEIYLPLPSADKDGEVQQSAMRLIKEIRGGRADFGAIAQRFSQAATAANGGQVGWVLEGSLAPELDEVLPTLNKVDIKAVLSSDHRDPATAKRRNCVYDRICRLQDTSAFLTYAVLHVETLWLYCFSITANLPMHVRLSTTGVDTGAVWTCR